MNQKESRRRIAYEALMLLLLLALLLFITRLWPILLLVILGIFVAMLRLLFLSSRKVPPTQPQLLLMDSNPGAICESERESLSGYSLLLRQITDRVLLDYPDARWIWESPNAQQNIALGIPVYILLNRAGGYQKAEVKLQEGRLSELVYLSASLVEPIELHSAEETETESHDSDPLPENYDLIAYEWVESHLLALNGKMNEVIGLGQTEHRITASELPMPESWNALCRELQRNGLEHVTSDEDGILIKIEQ